VTEEPFHSLRAPSRPGPFWPFGELSLKKGRFSPPVSPKTMISKAILSSVTRGQSEKCTAHKLYQFFFFDLRARADNSWRSKGVLTPSFREPPFSNVRRDDSFPRTRTLFDFQPFSPSPLMTPHILSPDMDPRNQELFFGYVQGTNFQHGGFFPTPNFPAVLFSQVVARPSFRMGRPESLFPLPLYVPPPPSQLTPIPLHSFFFVWAYRGVPFGSGELHERHTTDKGLTPVCCGGRTVGFLFAPSARVKFSRRTLIPVSHCGKFPFPNPPGFSLGCMMMPLPTQSRLDGMSNFSLDFPTPHFSRRLPCRNLRFSFFFVWTFLVENPFHFFFKVGLGVLVNT